MRFSNAFGACEVDSLPGCSQIAVSHSVFIAPVHRGKGRGAANHWLRLSRLKDLHYDTVICTVDKTNAKEIRNLTEFGWKAVHEFKSSKTGHTVILFVRNVE